MQYRLLGPLGVIRGDEVAEVLVGVELATTRHRDAREEYVEAVLASIPVLDYHTRVAIEHAGLLAAIRKAGRPRGAHALIIAATARATTGRTVITANPLPLSTNPESR